MVPRYDENGNRRPPIDVWLDIAAREWLWLLAMVLVTISERQRIAIGDPYTAALVGLIIVYPVVVLLRVTIWAFLKVLPTVGPRAEPPASRGSSPPAR